MTSTHFFDVPYTAMRQRIARAESLVLLLEMENRLPDPGIRVTLEMLLSRGDISIAIVCSCEMWDLRRRIGLPGIVYAGEHGLEIRGRGLQFLDSEALARRGVIKLIARELSGRLNEIPGVAIEEKHLTVAVDYRLATDDVREEIRDRVAAVLAIAGTQAELRTGKASFEILPRTSWGKTRFAEWIYKSLGNWTEGHVSLPLDVVAAGQAEETFQEMNEWITIRVPDNQGLHEFLTWLALYRNQRNKSCPVHVRAELEAKLLPDPNVLRGLKTTGL